MIFEHRVEADDEGEAHTPIPEDSPHKQLLGASARRCCTIEAATWEEAMQKYYEHMGWGRYKPMEPCE